MSHLSAPPPEPGVPGPFALGDPAHLRVLLDGAGFSDAEVEEIETELNAIRDAALESSHRHRRQGP